VVTRFPLRGSDLDGTEPMISELAYYPAVLIPNSVPAGHLRRGGPSARGIVGGTPPRSDPLVPAALAVGTRKKRMAITAEDPPAYALQPVAALPQVEGVHGMSDVSRAASRAA
jgi:chromosome partitioning protein